MLFRIGLSRGSKELCGCDELDMGWQPGHQGRVCCWQFVLLWHIVSCTFCSFDAILFVGCPPNSLVQCTRFFVQLLQVARIGAALALAPVVDAACSRAQQQLGLKSQRTALSLVIALCLGVAALCFGSIVLLWA